MQAKEKPIELTYKASITQSTGEVTQFLSPAIAQFETCSVGLDRRKFDT